MKRWRWLAEHWLRRLGWPGMAGLALAAVAAALYLALLLPARSQLEAARQATWSARELARRAAHRGGMEAESDASRLAVFYRALPPASSLPDWLSKVYRAARDQSIGLDRGEYKFGRDKGAKLAVYHINLPVRGSYVQIRKFVEQVLNQIPAAALEGISFKREDIGNRTVEARVGFSLYLAEQ